MNPHEFQIFVPNEVSVFGSAFHQVNLNHLATCDGVGSQILHIKKFHMIAIDKPSQHCNAESTEPNASACIADFIQRKLGLGQTYYYCCNNHTYLQSLFCGQ